MFYVYVLESDHGELYFGSTNDLKRRLNQHHRGESFSTRGKAWTLIYYKAYRNEADARLRESRIKQHGQAKAQLKKRFLNSRLKQS